MSLQEISISEPEHAPGPAIARPSAALVLPSATWGWMLAINLCLMAALFVYKIDFSSPDVQYTQLLADYHFGFMKRALIGALVGLVYPAPPSWLPFALGTVVWLVNAGCFALLFERVFGLRRKLPLFVFIIASPLFLKNFIQTLGFFDIYGCLLVTVFLLLPARSVGYVLAAAAGAVVLLLIHHLHMLLYIPTLIAVVAMRYFLVRPIGRAEIVVAGAALLCLAAVFLAVQFGGSPGVPLGQFEAYMTSRMAGPPLRGTIWAAIYYRTLGDEFHDTWNFMSTNLLRVPVYMLLIALHLPLIRMFRSIVRSLNSPLHRRAVVAAVVAVSFGYLVIFVTVFDYSRWVASWATCMILLLHAAKQLATATGVSLVTFDERRARPLAWVLTFVPRLGTVIPF